MYGLRLILLVIAVTQVTPAPRSTGHRILHLLTRSKCDFPSPAVAKDDDFRAWLTNLCDERIPDKESEKFAFNKPTQYLCYGLYHTVEKTCGATLEEAMDIPEDEASMVKLPSQIGKYLVTEETLCATMRVLLPTVDFSESDEYGVFRKVISNEKTCQAACADGNPLCVTLLWGLTAYRNVRDDQQMDNSNGAEAIKVEDKNSQPVIKMGHLGHLALDSSGHKVASNNNIKNHRASERQVEVTTTSSSMDTATTMPVVDLHESLEEDLQAVLSGVKSKDENGNNVIRRTDSSGNVYNTYIIQRNTYVITHNHGV